MTSILSDIQTPTSLKEIMDHELALKLQEEENELTGQKKTSPSFSKEEELDFDEELKLVLSISAQEAEKTSPHKIDADYMFALQIQQELDTEQLARYYDEKDRRKNDRSNVSYSYDLHFDQRGHHSYYKPLYEDEQGEDDEEIEDEVEEDEEDQKAKIQKIKPYHQVSKNTGRKTIVTKHDAVLTGIRNAEQVEQMNRAGNLDDIMISTSVYNSLKEDSRKIEVHATRVRGNKLDKSTHEQVMDKRTRVNLLQMINSGVLSQVHGIISTGKEANVYFGTGENTEGYAVKIFKTTLNEFKNRSDYIEGEFRFRHTSQAKTNPRRLIKLWTEKELRNLKRLQKGEIPTPTPIHHKENILVMTFLGKEGIPAPSLKDANLSEAKFNECYNQVVKLMRQMFHQCRLIHADLSEYNLLYHKSQVWVIDVSQAVEYDHPRALEFLRNDCTVITNFFGKHIDQVLSARELFEFVTDVNIQKEKVEQHFQIIRMKIRQRQTGITNEEKIREGVFQNSFIPRTLHEVKNPEKELFDHQESFHQTVTGVKEKSFE